MKPNNLNLFRAKRRLVVPSTQTSETKKTKKFPSFPLSNKRILDKVELITSLVESCFYALPFLATNRMDKEEDFDSDKPSLVFTSLESNWSGMSG